MDEEHKLAYHLFCILIFVHLSRA